MAHKHQIIVKSSASRTGQHRHYRRRAKAELARRAGFTPKKLRHISLAKKKYALPVGYANPPLAVQTLRQCMEDS